MNKRDKYYYPAILSYEQGEEISVDFPDLKVATSGLDDDDALNCARELLGITILGMEDDGIKLPEPTSLKEISLKKNERAILADVYMPFLRLAHKNKAISKTVTLPSWLDALAKEKGFNFSQVLQEALKKNWVYEFTKAK